MLNKPSREEDEYFAREDVEKKRKLAYEQHRVLDEQQREALKKLHYMKCPKCGYDLHPLKRGEVIVDTCFNCKGVWIDHSDMEHFQRQLQHPEEHHAVVGALLNIFKGD